MKTRFIALTLMLIALMLPSFAVAESDSSQFSENQKIVFETLKWNIDFPKNAQVKQATEYLCKVEGQQMHLLLIEASQNENIEMMFGIGAGIILVDMDTNEIITYTNCVWPETSDIASREDALNMLFSCYCSYVEGYNPFIYADHEITYPLTEEEINAINSELNLYFMR